MLPWASVTSVLASATNRSTKCRWPDSFGWICLMTSCFSNPPGPIELREVDLGHAAGRELLGQEVLAERRRQLRSSQREYHARGDRLGPCSLVASLRGVWRSGRARLARARRPSRRPALRSARRGADAGIEVTAYARERRDRARGAARTRRRHHDFPADTEQLGVEVVVGGGGRRSRSARPRRSPSRDLADGATIPIVMAPLDGFCPLARLTDAAVAPLVAQRRRRAC